MKRRSFLLGLLAAPLAPLLAKVLPKPPDIRHVARVCHIDTALLGSDSTSIWLVSWGDEKPREFTGPYAKWQRRMWLKGRIS